MVIISYLIIRSNIVYILKDLNDAKQMDFFFSYQKTQRYSFKMEI